MGEPMFIDSWDEMEQTLRVGLVGHLGLVGDAPPYAAPLTCAYVAEKTLFHCANTGQ
jgi:nitroimidazol reductase NimA-like FMN-containing flavoprotein (pyridoxamine 5'-phosphate oxidase superfamily)